MATAANCEKQLVQNGAILPCKSCNNEGEFESHRNGEEDGHEPMFD
jgi:hypothetical protein